MTRTLKERIEFEARFHEIAVKCLRDKGAELYSKESPEIAERLSEMANLIEDAGKEVHKRLCDMLGL